MNILESQREMRSAFLGGFAGQLVSGLIWLVAAALATWLSPAAGMAALFFGSMGIFPLAQGVARLMGRPGIDCYCLLGALPGSAEGKECFKTWGAVRRKAGAGWFT